MHRENFQDDAAYAARRAEPAGQGPSSQSEHAIAPPFLQAFASPFAHAFAVRSEPQFALTSAPAIVPNFEFVIAPPSAQAFESPSEPAFAPSSDQNFAARSEQSLALISEQNFTPPSDAPSVHRSSHSAPCTELPFASRSQQDFATLAEPFNVQPASSAAPWHRQLEARLLADWTSFFSEIGSSLASDPAAEPSPEHAAPTHPPRLHLVEAKTKIALGASSAANRKHAPGFQHLAPPSSRVAAAKSFAVSSALMKLMSLRLILVGWSAKSRARFSSTVTASANSSAMANVTQLSAGCHRPLRSLYWECLASADRCLDIAASIDWARLQINASRWLRQPCDPTQWRLLDSRLLEGMFRFNHRKL